MRYDATPAMMPINVKTRQRNSMLANLPFISDLEPIRDRRVQYTRGR